MFDARAAKALRPGEHIVIAEAPGLRLVATETRKTWTYRFKSPADGRMRQIRLGHWPAMGYPAALVAWQKMRDTRAAGVDPAREKRERRQQAATEARESRYTVRAACAEYLSAYAGTVTPKTYSEAERLLTGADLEAIADRPAAGITRADAFDTIEAMRDKPVVAARVRQLLGAVWDRALDAGRLPATAANWWRLILRGKLASRGRQVAGEHVGVGKRVLSEDELRLLLPWLPNFTRDIEDAITMYLWTGCRGAEILAMEAPEITEEPDGLWWTVPRAKLKMRRNPLLTDLRVPLEGRALAVVKRRLQVQRESAGAAGAAATSYLFPSRTGRHIEQKAVGVAVWMHMPRCKTRKDWVRPRLPVAGWSPHDLRRTVRTMLAALGCPAEVAEAILGHMLPGVQGAYNRHHYDAERRIWLTRLSDRLDSLAA